MGTEDFFMEEKQALPQNSAFAYSNGGGEELVLPELFWKACDGMMVIDAQRRVLAMNPALEAWVGRRAEGLACGMLLGCRDSQGCPMADRAGACPELSVIKTMEPVRSTQYTIQTSAGKTITVSASYTPLQSSPGAPLRTLVVLRDITAQHRLERRLRHRAMTDPLTGLPNRASFFEAAHRELAHARRMRRFLSMALIDLDGLKQHNDTVGHVAGDILLRSIAQVLGSSLRESEMVSRYGGDEFAVLLTDADANAAMLVAERLRRAVADFPFARQLNKHSSSLFYPVTVSLGVAVFPNDADSVESLLICADQRLYTAKHLGRNRIVGPGPQSDRRRHARVSLQARALIQNLPEDSNGTIQEAVVVDVSLSGAYLTLPATHRLKLEYPLLFAIEIPPSYQARFPFARFSGRANIVRISQSLPEDGSVQNRIGIAITFDQEPSVWSLPGKE